MTEPPLYPPVPGDSGRRGRLRANALSAGTFSRLGDVDPRVADALLGSLEDAGVAAYVEPGIGRTGGYLEVRLPASPAEALYVDASRRDLAEAVVAAELPGLLAELAPSGPDDDFDAIVARFDAEHEHAVPPWPVSEDVDALPRRRSGDQRRTPSDDDEEEEPAAAPRQAREDDHFVPPPPPPLPKVARPTLLAWAAVAIGTALLLVVALVTGEPASFGLAAVGTLLVVGGIATLVWRMRDAPPTDSGPDDGAVV